MELQEVVNELQKPTSLWPTTVVGWITLGGLIVSTIYNYIKFKEKPFANKVKEMNDYFDKEVKRVQEQFGKETVRVTEYFDQRFEELKEQLEEDVARAEQHMTHELNGFGGRIDGFNDRVSGMEKIQDGITKTLTELVRDREHTERLQNKIFDAVEKARTERNDSERRIMDGQQRILDTLARRGRDDD